MFHQIDGDILALFFPLSIKPSPEKKLNLQKIIKLLV